MFDGSSLPIEDNMRISKELLELCTKNQIILEVETGVVGGEEDGSVKLKPEILKQGQDAIKKKYGKDAGLYLVFHGGSGSSREEIWETLEYGVVKSMSNRVVEACEVFRSAGTTLCG